MPSLNTDTRGFYLLDSFWLHGHRDNGHRDNGHRDNGHRDSSGRLHSILLYPEGFVRPF